MAEVEVLSDGTRASVRYLAVSAFEADEIAQVLGLSVEAVLEVLAEPMEGAGGVEGESGVLATPVRDARDALEPRLLRPAELASAVVLVEAGTSPERVDELLSLPVGSVTRSMLARADRPVPPVWPPPPAPGQAWETRLARAQGSQGVVAEVRVRSAVLWGRQVWVDAAGLVWCPCCQRMLGAAELQRRGSGHPVGLAVPSGPWLTDGDDEPAVRERWATEMPW